MSRWVRSIAVLAGASAALLGTTAAVAHQSVARTATTCGVGNGKGYGYTYLTTLAVHGTSCGAGKSVVKSRGKGWKCAKKRLNTSPVQYEERQSCTSGSRSVVWTYSQNT
jgi:uncharacterized membrane protein